MKTVQKAADIAMQTGSRLYTDSASSYRALTGYAHAFVHQPLAIFDANIYYPFRHTLAYSENLIGSALIAAPVLWLTGNPVLALNMVALLSCVLCGVGAYVHNDPDNLAIAPF